jgi:methylenetetrahydrofolate dehydrogenase (NADP+) / methenyltetrahydrofolate cyclohydrolase
MVREDAIVIDVGCTFVEGAACGDADYDDLRDHVRAISPVPGGIGPMTVATLIEHTWRAYEGRYRLEM